MTLHIATDRHLVRSGAHSTRYLRVLFNAPAAHHQHERLPLDVALVIDRSGSMGGRKLDLAKEAARKAITLLGPRDHVALVAYDTEVELLAPGDLLDTQHRSHLLAAINQLRPGSTTNLSGGWLMGCEEVARAGREETVARTLLLSDGLANVGINSADDLAAHAGALRSRGVATTAFGIGADFDERLMEGMARAGGGNFYYIERAEQIGDFLMSELGEALEVVARDARLVVELDPGLMIHSMDDRRVTRSGRTVEIALDDMVSREQVELVLRVTFPQASLADSAGLKLSLVAQGEALQVRPVRFEWQYADHAANNAQPRDRAVDLAVARCYEARAREEAAEFNRAGDLPRAREVLLATARRINQYAGSDPELCRLVSDLEQASDRHRERFDAHSIKVERFMAYNIREKKDIQGHKIRG